MRKRRLLPLVAINTVAAITALTALAGVASADVVHVVRKGETLTSIAALDGLSEPALAAANGLPPTADLAIGALIEIPPVTVESGAATQAAIGAAPASTTADSDPAQNSGTYVVEPGDTLSGIAASVGTGVANLAELNGLDPNGTLFAGTMIELPGSDASTSVNDAAASTTVTAGDSGPYPTDEFVDGPTLAAIAQEYNVAPAFAEAIGWQESGWDNNVVSSTGAVGVMQIEPDTWDWLQNNVASDSLEPASATDNIRGGVLLLQDLLDQTGGSEADAPPAYYQGLGSVIAHGMYATTKLYVADVMALTARFGG